MNSFKYLFLFILLSFSYYSTAQINDTCAGAIDYITAFGPIVGDEDSPVDEDSLDLSLYSNIDNETFCSEAEDISAWYKWQATFDAISFTPGAGNPSLSVYKGQCGSLVGHACAGNVTNTLIENLIIDSVYYFNIRGESPGEQVAWSMRKASTLFEDVCECSLVIACQDTGIIGSIQMATDVDAEPVCQGPPGSGGVTMGPGIWIKTYGNGDTLIASTDNPGTNFNTELIVYSGSCDSLTCIGGDDDGGSGTTSTIAFESQIGEEYYIYVKGNLMDTGTYHFTLTCLGLDNESCENDSTLVMGSLGDCPGNLVIGTTDGASVGAVVCAPFSAPAVWYSFTTFPTQTSVNLQLTDLDMDAVHGYEILDSCGGTSYGCGNPAQNVISGLTPSTTYIVGIFGMYPGAFSLCVQESGPVPVNDLCAGALLLTCGSYYADSTTWATDADEYGPCSGPSGDGLSADAEKGVWFHFVGTGDTMTVSADFPGSSFDNAMDLYEGSCGSLTCVGSDGNSGNNMLNSKITFVSDAGTTYYVYLDGWQDETGNYEISLICSCPDSLDLFGSPQNKDDYETPGNLSSKQTILSGDTIDYDSELEIELLGGFEVRLGALFNAFIDGCDNGGGGDNLQSGQNNARNSSNGTPPWADRFLIDLIEIKHYNQDLFDQCERLILSKDFKPDQIISSGYYDLVKKFNFNGALNSK